MTPRKFISKAIGRIRRGALDVASTASSTLLGLNRGSAFASAISEHMRFNQVLVSDDKSYIYHTGSKLALFRAKTLFSKEPKTIAWLRQIQPGEVLYDVGANVGVYTIYAGVRGAKVFAFEPESSNYYCLSKNILLNKIDDHVTAYAFAISDTNKLDTLRLSNLNFGGANHSFAENKDFSGSTFKSVFNQGCIGFTLDTLIYEHGLMCPRYLKIDVDGLESKVLGGMNRLIKDPNLKSVLIELNTDLPEDLELVELFKNAGFKIKEKHEFYADTQWQGLCNFIFER